MEGNYVSVFYKGVRAGKTWGSKKEKKGALQVSYAPLFVTQ